MAVNTLEVTGTIADLAFSQVVTLSTPVPVDQSVPLLSCEGSDSVGADSRGVHFNATLQTIVGGNYTELLLERSSTAPEGSLVIRGEILYGTDLTVQMVTGQHVAVTHGASKTVSITAVTLAQAFIVGYEEEGTAAPGRTFIKYNFGSTTSVTLERGSIGASDTVNYTFYVVEWAGATVAEYDDITIAASSATQAQAITSVTLANTFFHMSYLVEGSGTAPDDNYIEGRLTSTTNFQITRDASPTFAIKACVYVISHPSLTVEQTAQTALVATTTGSATLSGTFAGTTTRFIAPGTYLGNARNNDASGNEYDRVAVKHAWNTSQQIGFTRRDGGDTTTVTSQAAQISNGPDPAVVSREPADIAAGEQTDTTAHVRIDSADATDSTNRLYGSTTNHGTTIASWEAATEVDASVATGDLVEWTGRTENTTYYLAVVSTDGSGGKTLSNVLTITTAYARPTSPAVGAITANSVVVTWTDASGGLASHELYYRPSADPVSSLLLAGVIPAGDPITLEFTGLTEDTEYSFEAVAYDGADRVSGRVAVTATPGVDWVTSAATSADGTTVIYTHDRVMADPAGQHGAYSFRENAGAARGYTAAALGADPTQIILTVDGSAIPSGATLDGSYTPGTVQSAAGNNLAAFTNAPIANTVESDLTITTWLLPTAVQGEAYSATTEWMGGTGPYTWDRTLGGYPTGVSFNLSTGVFSGTVGGSATSTTFTHRITDALGAQAIREFTITVVEATSPAAAPAATSGIIDVSAASLTAGAALPIVVPKSYTADGTRLFVSVEATPYSGWDAGGGDVTGYPGLPVVAHAPSAFVPDLRAALRVEAVPYQSGSATGYVFDVHYDLGGDVTSVLMLLGHSSFVGSLRSGVVALSGQGTYRISGSPWPESPLFLNSSVTDPLSVQIQGRAWTASVGSSTVPAGIPAEDNTGDLDERGYGTRAQATSGGAVLLGDYVVAGTGITIDTDPTTGRPRISLT